MKRLFTLADLICCWCCRGPVFTDDQVLGSATVYHGCVRPTSDSCRGWGGGWARVQRVRVGQRSFLAAHMEEEHPEVYGS